MKFVAFMSLLPSTRGSYVDAGLYGPRDSTMMADHSGATGAGAAAGQEGDDDVEDVGNA